MIDLTPSRAENERARLKHLNELAKRDPERWFPSANQRLCFFCGLNPRVPELNLCDSCDARRQMLTARYPDVELTTALTRAPIRLELDEPTPRLWLPHKNDE